jgi:hypothetical protein
MYIGSKRLFAQGEYVATRTFKKNPLIISLLSSV